MKKSLLALLLALAMLTMLFAGCGNAATSAAEAAASAVQSAAEGAAEAAEDAAEAAWFAVENGTVALPEGEKLAFDHAQIIRDAIAWLK